MSKKTSIDVSSLETADKYTGYARVMGDPSLIRVDIASQYDGYLFVIGWISSFYNNIRRAEIRYGDMSINVKETGRSVPRVGLIQASAQHGEPEGDGDGFVILVGVADTSLKPSYLRLLVESISGEIVENAWPVCNDPVHTAAFFRLHPNTLIWLLQSFDPFEAAHLRALSYPKPAHSVDLLPGGATNPGWFALDFCFFLESNFLLVVGRVDAQHGSLTSLMAEFNGEQIDLLPHSQFAPMHNEDPGNRLVHNRSKMRYFFAVTTELSHQGIAATSDVFIHAASFVTRLLIRRQLINDHHQAREECSVMFDKLRTEVALSILEHLASSAANTKVHSEFLEWLLSAHTKIVESLPISVEARTDNVFLECETVLSIADDDIFLKGWFYFPEGTLANVWCTRGFARIRIDLDWIGHPRLDVTEQLTACGIAALDDDSGFASYVSLPGAPAPYTLVIILDKGSNYRMRLSSGTVLPTMQAIHSVLTSFDSNHRSLQRVLDQHIGPAVQKAWRNRCVTTKPVTLIKFGRPIHNPNISIIVPLYGRYDFAEYQLALFADDADFQSLELIYFVDDPVIYDNFRSQCHGLFETYRVPFTLAFAGSNFGYAGANNCAAKIATGQHLLFMNSDVFPKTIGWVTKLASLYASVKDPGLLGVKLLYEDGSVQHAGIKFARYESWSGMWINEHPFKGQAAGGLTGIHKVHAVTAACAIIGADLFRCVGGFCDDYIIGDFEDSDLCLRVSHLGRQNWLTLDIDLYHLERQSQRRIGDAHWRTNLTLFNCWQHHQRWNTHITNLPI